MITHLVVSLTVDHYFRKYPT